MKTTYELHVRDEGEGSIYYDMESDSPFGAISAGDILYSHDGQIRLFVELVEHRFSSDKRSGVHRIDVLVVEAAEEP